MAIIAVASFECLSCRGLPIRGKSVPLLLKTDKLPDIITFEKIGTEDTLNIYCFFDKITKETITEAYSKIKEFRHSIGGDYVYSKMSTSVYIIGFDLSGSSIPDIISNSDKNLSFLFCRFRYDGVFFSTVG